MTDSERPLQTPRLRRRHPNLATVLGACLSLSFVTSAALAQQAPHQDDSVLAETLFRAGRALMDQGKFAEACPKLEESYRADAAPGTLLALASCHEQQGRVAMAWGEFTQSVAAARRDNRSDREQFARDHIAALEPVLPHVVVDVPEESRANGLVVTRNGTALTAASWGLAIPCDPGDVVVTATAEGYKSWSTTLTAAKGATVHALVPKLEAAPLAPPPSQPPSVVASASAQGAMPMTFTPPPAAEHRFRPLGAVLGGVGIASLGVGTYFGLEALSKQSQSNSACPVIQGARDCNAAGVSASSSAVNSARWADVTLGVGLAALAAGTALFIVTTAPSDSAGAPNAAGAEKKSVAVAPTWSPSSAGFVVVGAF